MSLDSGLWPTLAVVLPLVAAAPFVGAAAYIVVRVFKASAESRAQTAGAAPGRVAVEVLGGAADTFDTAGAPPLGTVARRAHEELLAREATFDRLRRTGHGAPARILDLADTGIRIGDGASMLRFGLEVQPSGRPAFRAQTHCAVSDASRERFAPGATVSVKFGAYGGPVVAVDYAS